MKGKAFKFGDNISTDHIAPGRLYHLRSDLNEFAKHVLEDADETFASRMNKGDFVVAGNNFGLGSSREHAPRIITNLTNGTIIQIEPLPPVMIKLLNDGGLVEHIKKYGDFKLTD